MAMAESAEARTILKPIVDEFCKLFDERHIDETVEYYDKDAVIVQLGKKATFGKEAIKHEIEEMTQPAGKASTKISDDAYYQAGDFIILEGKYEVNTEKAGSFKGTFTQFWRKTGEKYLSFHDHIWRLRKGEHSITATAMAESAEARTILKPIVEEFCKLFDERHIDETVEYYDKDAVVVQHGKKATFGKEAIKREIEEIVQPLGKASTKIFDDAYYQAGDFIIFDGKCEVTTEKAGPFKGAFTQFWRKTGEKYLITYDAYTLE